jgi:hypothetical protein
MSTFMDIRLRRDFLLDITLLPVNHAAVCALLLFVLGFWCHPYLCAQTMIGFRQSPWGSEDGIGAVFDIQQCQDGYLWLTNFAAETKLPPGSAGLSFLHLPVG